MVGATSDACDERAVGLALPGHQVAYPHSSGGGGGKGRSRHHHTVTNSGTIRQAHASRRAQVFETRRVAPTVHPRASEWSSRCRGVESRRPDIIVSHRDGRSSPERGRRLVRTIALAPAPLAIPFKTPPPPAPHRASTSRTPRPASPRTGGARCPSAASAPPSSPRTSTPAASSTWRTSARTSTSTAAGTSCCASARVTTRPNSASWRRATGSRPPPVRSSTSPSTTSMRSTRAASRPGSRSCSRSRITTGAIAASRSSTRAARRIRAGLRHGLAAGGRGGQRDASRVKASGAAMPARSAAPSRRSAAGVVANH